MAKNKKNEDSIKDLKKASRNFIKLLSEKKVPFFISIICNIISTILVVSIPWTSAIAIDRIVEIMGNEQILDKWTAIFNAIPYQSFLSILFL